MSRLEDVWKKEKYCLPDWEARFIGRGGIRLEEIPRSLGLYKNIDPGLKPDIIVVCAFLVDALKMVSSEVSNQGRYLKLREEAKEGKDFPAPGGFKGKVRKIWVELKDSFKEAKIIWTIPHPVDCLRWRHIKGMKGVDVSACMTWHEHVQCQGESFKILQYFRGIDDLMLEEFGSGWWTIPWVIFWKKQCRNLELPLEEWETGCKEGRLLGFFNESGSEEGLHPSPGSCRGVLGSVVSRMKGESKQLARRKVSCTRLMVRESKIEDSIPSPEEVAIVNRRMMINLADQTKQAGVSEGTITECWEKNEMGCHTPEDLGGGSLRPSKDERMTILLDCLHVKVAPREYWFRLAEIQCSECNNK